MPPAKTVLYTFQRSVNIDIQFGILVEGSNLIVIRNPCVLGVAGGGADGSRLLLTALEGKLRSDGCPGFEYRQAVFAHSQFANDSGR